MSDWNEEQTIAKAKRRGIIDQRPVPMANNRKQRRKNAKAMRYHVQTCYGFWSRTTAWKLDAHYASDDLTQAREFLRQRMKQANRFVQVRLYDTYLQVAV